MALTHGGLFEGIGGFSLGFEWAGIETLWHVEREPFRQAVLRERFPGVPCFGDVTTVDPADLAGVDIVSAGFPCTNTSNAGDRTGLDGAESGLWREVVRVVRGVRPRYVVVENVAALLARGFGTVLGDLAALGFDAEWDCIPAGAAGAPHLRDRLWLVAYADSAGRPQQRRAEPARAAVAAAEHDHPVPADAARGLLEGDERSGLREGGPGEQRRRRPRDVPRAPAPHEAPAEGALGSVLPAWRDPLTQLESRDTGASHGPAPEPFLHGVDAGVPDRVDRCDALGDTLLPQIAEFIARKIVDREARLTAV